VKDGGGTFRARFGVQRDGVNLLAEGSYSKGSELTDGYPEFTMAVLKKLGWDKDLTADEMAQIRANSSRKRDGFGPLKTNKNAYKARKIAKFYEAQNENIETLLKPVEDLLLPT